MTLAERILEEAIYDKWPPELLQVVLDKVEDLGYDLTSRAGDLCRW